MPTTIKKSWYYKVTKVSEIHLLEAITLSDLFGDNGWLTSILSALLKLDLAMSTEIYFVIAWTPKPLPPALSSTQCRSYYDEVALYLRSWVSENF